MEARCLPTRIESLNIESYQRTPNTIRLHTSYYAYLIDFKGPIVPLYNKIINLPGTTIWDQRLRFYFKFLQKLLIRIINPSLETLPRLHLDIFGG